MNRYTVVWHAAAISDLAEIWMSFENSPAVRSAVQEIDQLLKIDPERKG